VAKVTGEIQRARASGGLLFALGVATDAWQMKKAINRSFETGTVRPAAAQATRSLTTWGAVWAGAELLGLGGALLGIETGPGVVVTSSVGAIVGGCIGLFASDWLARKIDDVRLEVTAEKSFTRYRVE
jgi:outer membrane lipoprotein SlyB